MDIRPTFQSQGIGSIQPVTPVGRVRRFEQDHRPLLDRVSSIRLRKNCFYSFEASYGTDEKNFIDSNIKFTLLELNDDESAQVQLEISPATDRKHIKIMRENPGRTLYETMPQEVTDLDLMILKKGGCLTIMAKDMVCCVIKNAGKSKDRDTQEFIIVEYQDV